MADNQGHYSIYAMAAGNVYNILSRTQTPTEVNSNANGLVDYVSTASQKSLVNSDQNQGIRETWMANISLYNSSSVRNLNAFNTKKTMNENLSKNIYVYSK